MKTYSDLRKANELQKFVDELKTAVEKANNVFAIAQELLKKWDGKVLNKRFATQLQEMFPEDVVRDTYKYKETSIFYGQDWGNKRIHFSFVGVGYDIAQEIHTEFTFYKKNHYREEMLTSADRINAENCCKELQRLINSNLERLLHYQDALDHFSEYESQYQKAKEDFFKALSNINPYFKEREIRTYVLEKTEWEKRMDIELQDIIK